jgi:hypothetical protein
MAIRQEPTSEGELLQVSRRSARVQAKYILKSLTTNKSETMRGVGFAPCTAALRKSWPCLDNASLE